MATYPNFPSGFVYDLARDGTYAAHKNFANVVKKEFTVAELDALASWSTGYEIQAANETGGQYLIFLFPEQAGRHITGVNWAVSASNAYTNQNYVLSYSTDTTTGLNNTWTPLFTAPQIYSTVSINQMRGNLIFPNLSGVKGLRLFYDEGYTFRLHQFMVWGTTPQSGLVPWHPTEDVPMDNNLSGLDRGDILQTAPPVVQTFRVKNQHGTSTAQATIVQGDGSGDGGKLATELLFSLDNTNFFSTITLADLAPGQISPLIYMKRPTPTDPPGTIRVANVKAEATSWTVV